MYALDTLAALALAFGAILGAKKGLWRLAAGGTAVGLGAAAGWATSDVLAAALRDWGVGAPGNAILGFLLPFAVTSVYVRFIIGLWLSRKLEEKPAHNRALGAAAGVVWMAFLAGFVARAAGLDALATGPLASDSAGVRLNAGPREVVCATSIDGGMTGSTGVSGPLTRWLARWPGELGARMYLSALAGERKGRIADAFRQALDTDHARRRASDADAEAITSVREAGFVRLGIDPARDDHR